MNATAETANQRYVRACRIHMLELQPGRKADTLRCPGVAANGAHTVTEWMVVDRQRLRVVCRANSSSDAVMEVRMPVTVPVVSKKAQEKTRQRERRALRSIKLDHAGSPQVLWLRLETADCKDPATRYRVRWQHLAAGGSCQMNRSRRGLETTGVAAACETLPEGQRAYDAELARLKAGGWREAPCIQGYRRIAVRPAPLPEVAERDAQAHVTRTARR